MGMGAVQKLFISRKVCLTPEESGMFVYFALGLPALQKSCHTTMPVQVGGGGGGWRAPRCP